MTLKCTIVFVLIFFTQCVASNIWAQNSNGINTSNSENTEPSRGESVIAAVKNQSKFFSEINDAQMASLPIGLARTLGNGKTYALFIDSATYEDHSVLSLYTEFNVPGTNVNLVFAAKNLAFTNNSLKFTETTRFQLERSSAIKISEHVILELAAGAKNYIDWDCNGFKEVNLEGLFKFSSDIITPEKPTPTNNYVTATVKIHATDFNNMLAAVSMSPFQIKGLDGFVFEAQDATVDLSDEKNPDGLSLTAAELSASGGDANSWRGFFLKQMKVTLPPIFSKDNGDRPSISATNLRIDDFGVTGTFSAENIFKLGDASAGGWPISIKRIDVQLVHNKLRGGGLGGELAVSLLGDKPLTYLAKIEDREGKTYYAFSVAIQEEVKFETFLGDISLYPNSSITLEKVNDEIIGTAVLHGRVDIEQQLLKAPGIKFQDLTVCTKAPYVRKGTFSVDGSINCKIAGYGIQFEKLTLGILRGQLTLSSKITLDLMNSSDKGFSGSAEVSVVAKQEERKYTAYVNNKAVEKTSASWKIDKVTVGAISLEVSVSAFQLKGTIQIFDEDPVYGNGFQGSLSVKIPSLKTDIKANAYFGTKTDNEGSFKYYHVDAKVPLGPTGIILFPAISMYAITGGLSYRMERPNDFDPYAVSRNVALKEGGFKPIDAPGAKEMVQPIFKYVPSRQSGYGFLAGVTIGTTGTKSLLNADLMFEVLLSENGGLRYVKFDGSMFVLSPFDLRGATPKDEAGQAAMFVEAHISYDNEANSLHGKCLTYINVAGGVLKGVNDRGLVGEIEFYHDNDKWWYYIGRPSQMLGISILGILEAKTYFQIGTKVEDMPPIPNEVQSIVGQINRIGQSDPNQNLRGFGFGAHFKASFGVGENGGFFYAYLKAGAGSDVLLRNYGQARCKGSGELGINGWYASGQAYAYIEGAIGIRVKVFGKRKKFDLASLGAAAVLQAELPNPSWFKGVVGVRYSILGGLIKGRKNLGFEIGSRCEMIGGKEINIEIIKDFLPDATATDVSVFASPQASFNFAVEKPFQMMNNEDIVTTYRIKLQSFTFSAASKSIPGDINFTAEKDAVNFVSHEILPPTTTVDGNVILFVEKEAGSAGNWIKVLDNGAPMTESKSVSFKTGEAPNYIPQENIAYTYPKHKQYNFFPKEYNTGYIKLKQGQAYLFAPSSGTGSSAVNWKYETHVEANNREATDVPFTYDEGKRMLAFNFPANMINNMVYRIGIIKTPLNGGNAANNVQQNSVTTIEEEGDTSTITTNSLKGMAISNNAVMLYQLSFRASKFNSFKEKLASQRGASNLWDVTANVQPVIGKRYEIDEAFDLHDLDGTVYGNSLVQIEADEDNAWLKTKVSPLLYNPYPSFASLGLGISYRNTDFFGIKPIKAVKVHNNDVEGFELTEAEMAETIVPGKNSRIRYMYYLNHISNLDHFEMRNKAVNKYLTTNAASKEVQNLMLNVFPELENQQTYKIKVKYVLPGTNIVSSTADDAILFY